MTGSDHAILYVDTEPEGQDITLYIIRDTPLGISELEHKLTLSLMGVTGEDSRSRLKEALIAVVERL